MECSSVVFQEEENAHTEHITAIEFPDNADEFHKENSPSRQDNSPSRQDYSKSNHFIVTTANWLRAAGRYTYIPVTVIMLSELLDRRSLIQRIGYELLGDIYAYLSQ